VWEADGIESTVAIDANNGYAFVVNGKSDGNALTDAATQIGVSILGAVLHKDPKTALVIGLGTGESAGWLAEMRGIERVDVVELEPAIDEMASRCKDVNFDVLNHPRVRRIYNDGREFVLTTDQKYDVIISEPSNPYRAGVAALYTTEFYQAVRERLNPGGLFIQWLQAYEVDEFTVSTVLATVGSEFAHVEVWQTLAADLQLVCSNTPIEYSAADLRERIESGTVKEALAKAWAVDDLEGFLGHFAAGSRWTHELVQSPLLIRNTDDRTILEYTFAKTVGRSTPFTVEAVRARIQPKGYHQPTLAGDDVVDWRLVELRRQQFNLLLDGQLSHALLTNPADRALVEAFNSFRGNDFAAAVEHLPAEYRQPKDNVQRLILARCYAELARPDSLDLLVGTTQQFPAEAAAVEATYHWRKGEIAAATDALERFFAVLAKDPWSLSIFADTAFARTIDIAKADADAARRLYKCLSEPFASLRFDYVRCLARVMVAKHLDSKSVVEALADLEPHVAWTDEILELRAKAYADTRHPLAAKAERDWKRYQKHQTAK
jgi:spermidine synthase